MFRKLTATEKKLITCLPIVDDMYKKIIKDQLDNFIVSEMDDGGMGSLYFVYEEDLPNREYKKCIAQIETKDLDNIPVLISLDIDNFERVHELDIWKSDFSSLNSLDRCLDYYTMHLKTHEPDL